ncbi:MAG: biotin/lipoyl-binding protein [Planctomycetes bacterium]|nr:biotin/lipoyl-binding protein [Planctomycetota bacterium]MCP4772116.1 biotin/lipoyl-binding protein [Planctomycetota bacterium]MCP4862211.1 biotin/lipoyl-binding protein [Planctomycetota bacterium]
MAIKKIPVPLNRRVDFFRRKALPVAVWAAAVIGVVQLMELRSAGTEFAGITYATDHVVSAPINGRVLELSVGMYDQVAAGQVLVTMDSSAVMAQINTASAEVERLATERLALVAELRASVAEMGRDWEKDARRFEMDAVDLRVELMRRNIELSTSRVEAERLRVAFERATALLESSAGSEANAEDLELALEVELERIRTTEQLVSQLEGEYARAITRHEEFMLSAPEDLAAAPRLEALQQAVRVQSLRLAEIELAREALVVRAPVYGQVRSVLASSGRSVVLGQDLLVLTPSGHGAVVFYQPPGLDSGVTVGSKVAVRRLGNGEVAEAIVTVMSPTIEELPRPLWRDPAVPEYGRAAGLSAVQGLHLVPGEPVRVSLE